MLSYEGGELRMSEEFKKFTKELNLIRGKGTSRGIDWDLLDEYIDKYLKPCSKKALKRLSKKEIQLKELWMNIVEATKASNKEVIRVNAWMINALKKIK